MSDSVVLQIAGRRIDNFLSYEIEADLYQAADKFSLELASPESPVAAGDLCELYVNGILELSGIIDVTRKAWSKGGQTLTVEGRDLMGLVVDSYAEQFVDVENKTVKELAQMLLASIPYVNRKSIVGGEFIGKGKGKKKTVDNPLEGFISMPQKISHIEPGMTVFEILAIYASSRGLMPFSCPDGSIVFGRPKAKGESSFTLTCNLSGKGNNVLSAEEVNDISRRYSKVTVISQVQGHDSDGEDTGKVNQKSVKLDPTFTYFYKPYVTKLNSDSQAPALHARMIIERQRHEGYQLSYTAEGHSQNGRNFSINELVQVNDERLAIKKQMLLFGRVFRRSRGGGTTTLLKLGPPGLVAV